MPGNIVKINNYDDLQWYVGDSRMEELFKVLDEIGYKRGEKHKGGDKI